MLAADFDSLDFITFQADASRGKVRNFTACPVVCDILLERVCALSSAESLEVLTINLQIRLLIGEQSENKIPFRETALLKLDIYPSS